MEWTEIDYNGTIIWATNFCGGVMVSFIDPANDLYPEHVPGWDVRQPRGDMDGPALCLRKTQPQVFNLLAVEQNTS